MSRTLLRVLVLALVLAAAALLPRLTHHVPPPSPAPPAMAPARDASAPAGDLAATGGSARGFGAAVGFRSRERLREHFQKHGAEFGAASAEDYLRRAQALRDRPAGGDVQEAVRADGVVTRFDRASGAFLAFGPDGVIRTYFKPNDGENYFRRQLEREH